MNASPPGVCLALCLWASAAAAGEAPCDGTAEQFDGNGVSIAHVLDYASRVNFIKGPDEIIAPGGNAGPCPTALPACRLKSYVVPGNVVLVSSRRGDFVCATYVSPRAVETDGWLPAAALAIDAPAPAAKLGDWTGVWRRVEATISVKVKSDRLEVHGEATWGAGDPERVQSGGVHTGEFDGLVAPRGALAAVGEGYDGSAPPQDDSTDCRVRLRLFDPYLVVDGNGACGGVNVRFDGVYVR